MSRLFVPVVVAAVVFALPAVAQANPRALKKIEQKTQEAMEYYDLLEYEEARKHLNLALTYAKKAGLEEDPAIAGVHLRLAIVYFSGLNDVESAKLSFINAVELDPDITIDPAYKTGPMQKLLEEAKAEFGGAAAPSNGGGDVVAMTDDSGGVDCAEVAGIKHTIEDTAQGGKKKKIFAHVSADLNAAKVALHYRPQGKPDFVEVKMKKAKGCEYVGYIPAKAIAGEFLHYYVAAYNKANKVIASKGSAGSPNIIEVAAGGGGGMDEENPLGGGGGGPRSGSNRRRDTGGSIGGTVGPKKPSKLYLSVAVGSGGAYVSGDTEQEQEPVSCCFAPALLHLFPEVGYHFSPKMSMALAFRMGFPLGADLQGHRTAAPAGMLRLRYALKDSGEGLMVSGALGGGLIAQTVPLNANDKTDTTVIGPLIAGGGVGWIKAMGGPLKIVAEMNALMGIPIISEMGTCDGSDPAACTKPNFGIQFDFNLGLLFAF